MAERRGLRRSELKAAWKKRKQSRAELGYDGGQKSESVQESGRGGGWEMLGGGDIPGREDGMCKGEARRLRGGKQISKAQE